MVVGPLLLLLVLAAGARPARAFEFYGNLQGGISGGRGIPTTSSLQQNQAYRIGESIPLNFTDAISGGVAIGYSGIHNSGYTSDTLTPSGMLSVHNDLFSLGMSAKTTSYRRSNAKPVDISQWGISLVPFLRSLPWFEAFFRPSLQLNYSEQQVSSPNSLDVHSDGYGGRLGLTLPGHTLFTYSYNRSRTENRLTRLTTDGSSHAASLFAKGKFWKDRCTVQFAQFVSHSSSTSSGIVPASGAIEKPFVLSTSATQTQFYAREEQTSVAVNPYQQAGSPLLSIAPQAGQKQTWGLVLSGLRPTPGSTNVTTDQQQPPQQLNKLRLAIVSNDTATPPPATYWEEHKSDLTWTLYATTDDFNSTTASTGGFGVTWQPVEVAAGSPVFVGSPGTTNSSLTTPYFEIDLAAPLDLSQYKALEIVVSYQPSATATPLPLQINAVEGVAVEKGTPGSRFSTGGASTSFYTSASMRFLLSSTLAGSSYLTMGYGAGYYNGRTGFNLAWSPFPNVHPSLSFDATRQHATGVETRTSRTYAISVPVTLLPTFNVGFGATRLEHFQGGVKVSTEASYLFSANAILYPDLTASYSESFNTFKSTGTRTGDSANSNATAIDAENYTSTLSLQANLTPKLSCSLDNTYSRIFKPRPLPSPSFFSQLNVAYRLSEMISMTGILGKSWSGGGSPNRNFVLGMTLLNTSKARAGSSYQYSKNGQETARQSLGLDGSLEISRMLSLQSNAYYNITQMIWGVSASLHIRIQ